MRDPGLRQGLHHSLDIRKRIDKYFFGNRDNLRLPSIELGLSSPAMERRIYAGRQLGRLMEQIYSSSGLPSVLDLINRIVERPTLFYKSKDPRLDSGNFDPERAKLNVRMGILMALQVILKDGNSPLARELFDLFIQRGLIQILKEAREDRQHLEDCRSANYIPPQYRQGDAIDYFLKIFKYCVAVAIVQHKDMKEKYFADFYVDPAQVYSFKSMREGVVNTIAGFYFFLTNAERQKEGIAELLREELNEVVFPHLYHGEIPG